MTLRTPLIIILAATFLVNIGCGVDKTNLKIRKNDTTEIFKFLIDSAFYKQRLLDFGSLKRCNPFGDTIIFQFDSILIGHLPPDLKFKILTEDEICSLATLHYNDSACFCNFLVLVAFQKNDTAYEVMLENQCVLPLFDKKGNLKFSKFLFKDIADHKCWFGVNMCGGVVVMTFKKQADTLKAKIEGFWYSNGDTLQRKR